MGSQLMHETGKFEKRRSRSGDGMPLYKYLQLIRTSTHRRSAAAVLLIDR